MDLGDHITKHVKLHSLTTIAAAATVVSILGYTYSRSKKPAGYKEIPLAKGWIPYFGHLWTYVFSGNIVGMEMA
ncbi:hypothetical protein K492DRAFT_176764 [Lichtheimia hyalospora FSU 10163]|nr:hypothetical protein K492DRAFT_176764 [Lichtheimia hyalospora FSU 10163]